MDLSKLPRLSKTDTPAPDPPPADPLAAPAGIPPPPPAGVRRGAFCDRCGAALRPGARFCDSCGSPVAGPAGVPAGVPDYGHMPMDDFGFGGEAWISLVFGVVFLFFFPGFWKFLANRSRTDMDAIDGVTGAVIPYIHSAFVWRDAGQAVFAVTLVLEGLVLLVARRRLVLLAASLFSFAAAAFDLFVVVKLLNVIGFEVFSALGFAACAYIGYYQWRLVQHSVKAQHQA